MACNPFQLALLKENLESISPYLSFKRCKQALLARGSMRLILHRLTFFFPFLDFFASGSGDADTDRAGDTDTSFFLPFLDFLDFFSTGFSPTGVTPQVGPSESLWRGNVG